MSRLFSPEFEAMTSAIEKYTTDRCHHQACMDHGSHESVTRPADARAVDSLETMHRAIAAYTRSRESLDERKLRWLGGTAHRRYHGEKGCGQRSCEFCVQEPR